MRKHPQLAYDMLYPIIYLRPALDIPYCHHEWWDWQRLPTRVKGENIPMVARIFTVGDIWDALTRTADTGPNRSAGGPQAGDGLPVEQAGKKLDPRVVRVFLHLLESESRQAFTTNIPPGPLINRMSANQEVG